MGHLRYILIRFQLGYSDEYLPCSSKFMVGNWSQKNFRFKLEKLKLKKKNRNLRGHISNQSSPVNFHICSNAVATLTKLMKFIWELITCCQKDNIKKKSSTFEIIKKKYIYLLSIKVRVFLLEQDIKQTTVFTFFTPISARDNYT